MNVPPLHVVATDEVAGRTGFAEQAEELQHVAGSALALHLRLRTLGGGDLYRIAKPLADRAASSGGWCVVNGRVDVALAAEAQAVQLGRGALPVLQARSVLCGRAAVGASVHSAEGAVRRAAEGADYLVVGTVFPTATHPGRKGGGPRLVRDCVAAGVPVVGIGGIDRQTAVPVLHAGAAGIAVVRAVWDQSDPIRAAAELLDVVRTTVADET